ncbi:MAG: AmmeMemoRadiSam system radical SAM enzyme [Anaerolineae bacterium]|nr:AmmeMemoRadiSam system radical SAM enzyme [Anaerolineae bacterium]
MHKAYLFKSLQEGVVQCQVCEHFCTIRRGEKGKCGVRYNDDGVLYLTVYGRPVTIHIDPIEKKPLYHFLPGEKILSLGTYGCNFRCPFCQNWSISQQWEEDARASWREPDVTPEMLVEACQREGATMIAYTYNEPTVFFEYTYDTARLAREHGLRNVYVSNGFMSEQALEMISPYLDGINVDLKAFRDAFYRQQCQGRLAPVQRNIRTIAQETDIWIEITTLLIPGLNDDEEELREMAGWLAGVDPAMPWHISAFHPDYQMLDRPPTPSSALLRAYEIGREAGLEYIYLGNVMDVDRGSTYCPACGELLIRRHWYAVEEKWQERGRCHRCGHAVPGLWS